MSGLWDGGNSLLTGSEKVAGVALPADDRLDMHRWDARCRRGLGVVYNLEEAGLHLSGTRFASAIADACKEVVYSSEGPSPGEIISFLNNHRNYAADSARGGLALGML